MADYQLYYFNLRGRAELSRLILAYAAVDYEDIRIERADWPPLKDEMPFGQIPVLKANGKTLAQSLCIARFLARSFKLTGKDEWEAAVVDSYVDFVHDISNQVRTFIWEQDPEKQRQLADKFRQEALNPGLSKIEEHLEKNGTGYVVGDQMTWADLAYFNFYDFISLRFGVDWLSQSTLLARHHEMIAAIPNIKKWIESRPQAPL